MVRLPPWYRPVRRHWSRYWPRPPVRGQMHILLSLRMTMHVLAHPADVVERLEDDAGRERPVADDGDGVAVAAAEQFVAGLEAR